MAEDICGTYMFSCTTHFSDGTTYQMGEIVQVQRMWLTSGSVLVRTMSDGKDHLCFIELLLGQERI